MRRLALVLAVCPLPFGTLPALDQAMSEMSQAVECAMPPANTAPAAVALPATPPMPAPALPIIQPMFPVTPPAGILQNLLDTILQAPQEPGAL